jgi:histidine triad (HIT) family protein
MADCIFCKIAAGVIPSERIYEDGLVFAFMDINPVAKGHVLVIPKRHSTDVAAMTDDEIAAVARALRRIAPAARAAVHAEGFNILNNAGHVAGQAVDHVHFHIIPRSADDGRGYRWITLQYRSGEISEIARAITKGVE